MTPLGTRVRRAGRLFILVAALLATYAAFFIAAMKVAVKAREVEVPNLRGKSVTEATGLLANLGLGLRIDLPRQSDATIPAEHVLSQDPEVGTKLRTDRTVHVRVSEGVRQPVVPLLAGQSERAAQLELAQDQVKVGATLEIHSGQYAADTVIAQDPPAETRNATVSLLVNRGSTGATYVMPDLIGTMAEDAAELLRKRSFRVTVVAQAPYPGLPAGIVIRQTPQAGFQISPGDVIQIEKSR